MKRPIVELFVESTEPRIILDMVLSRKIPAQRRNMRLHPWTGEERLKANPLMRCGADYAFFVNGRPVIGIERKAMPDAVFSLLPSSRRPRSAIFRQLDTIKVYPIHALLLEGQLPPELKKYEAVLVGIQFWCLRNGFFVFHTSGMGGTAKALIVIYNRLKSASPQSGSAAFPTEEGWEQANHASPPSTASTIVKSSPEALQQ